MNNIKSWIRIHKCYILILIIFISLFIIFGVLFNIYKKNNLQSQIIEKVTTTTMSTEIKTIEETKNATTTQPTEKVESSNIVNTSKNTETVSSKETFSSLSINTQKVQISQDEFDLICSVVMTEAGGGSFDGMAAVAQCFYNAMELEGKDAYYIYNHYGYAGGKTPNETVKEAVCAVFYDEYRVTDEPIIVFYAPAIQYSAWHESQIYVCSYDGNKFFKYRNS